MEDKSQVIIDKQEVGGGEEEEEFYEKIEAPKFVDFTDPNPYRPDDKYWFCLRVGCDQKHEEELDPEEISRNFVLRVMAARSPNIRLRKMLNIKSSNSVNEKCPLSAPPKPSKPRAARLAVVSSISQRLVDAKGKAKSLPKLNSTPHPKARQVAAKYLTTPRNKKCLPNPNSFRSVQNPKPTSLAMPKNRMVAKALVFHSPKKVISIKTSAELRTPLTKLCEGMRKLEISSQRKRALGNLNKKLKENGSDPNRLLPVDSSRRQLSACKNRSKGRELPRPPNCKERETKSLRSTVGKTKRIVSKTCSPVPRETVENDSKDKEIETKSRNRNDTEETLGSIDSAQEDASTGETNCLLSAEEGNYSENDFSKPQANSEDGSESNDGIDKENTKACSEKRESQKHNQPEFQTSGLVVGHEAVDMESDDKENASASEANRDLGLTKNHSGRKIVGKQETYLITKKAKNLKGASAVAATGNQVMKLKKPKSTNPKPFRLRTDERGILKEANLERRLQSSGAQKETAVVTEKELQKDERRNTASSRTSEGQARPRTATTTPQRRSKSTPQKLKPVTGDVASQKTENSLRKKNSPSLQGQFIRPKGVSLKTEMASYLTSGKQLSVIKEHSSTASRSQEAGEQQHSSTAATTTANKATTSPASRSLSRGKRPVTIPKEPHFHSVHVPKSCSRKPT
ncbi:uncharacterized protein LOC127801270 isoform X2 [Diospyros lotus]|uniref:uncharacterized protein LOC127801270 isoform X2 n=1 Tax=Diospyros lotus TaxID=55363 RepID=UPI002254A737|nr:uncharacterized protein LOC127801270 isoform X2 [Diospyros lotus]